MLDEKTGLHQGYIYLYFRATIIQDVAAAQCLLTSFFCVLFVYNYGHWGNNIGTRSLPYTWTYRRKGCFLFEAPSIPVIFLLEGGAALTYVSSSYLCILGNVQYFE